MAGVRVEIQVETAARMSVCVACAFNANWIERLLMKVSNEGMLLNNFSRR